MSLIVRNICSSIIETEGAEAAHELVSEFRCARNPDVEKFVVSNAVGFAQQGICITFLVYEEETAQLAGIFAIANKVLKVPREKLSRTMQRKLAKFSDIADDDEIALAAPIVAQLGRCDSVSRDTAPGAELLGLATGLAANAMRIISGRVVYLECEDEPKILAFYQREGFRAVGMRVSDSGVTYHVLIRFLSPIGGEARAA